MTAIKVEPHEALDEGRGEQMPGQVLTADEIRASFGEDGTYLGTGSFGETWHVGNQALKIIHDPTYPLARLQREVDGLQRVSHPGVVRLEGISEAHIRGQAHAVLHFEFIAGGDLGRRFDDGNWPTQDDAIHLLVGLLEAVKALHSDGTVHRDIKPANIVLRDGRWENPVLLDLGLARNHDDSTLTIYPSAVGTPRYMAPEQWRGDRARKTVDLFSVGVVVREAINHHHPFFSSAIGSAGEALARIQAGPEPLVGALPTKVRDVLDALVSPAPHQRGSAVSALKRMNCDDGSSSV